MTVTKVKRLVNPHKAKAKRKLSPAQIRIFGTPAQKAALSGGRGKTRNPAARKRRVKARSNPASLITLGLVNPHKVSKGRKTVTKRRKRTTPKASNPVRRRRRVTRASNPVRRRATARRNPRTTRRRTTRRNGTKIYVMKRNGARRTVRRNPEVFGMRGKDAATAILAGLVGVYATKTIVPMVASAVPSIGGSPVISALISSAVAYGGGMLLMKWDKTAGQGFMFGGLMQAGSSLLNLVVPANPLSLSGLGDFAPASFPVPQNPIMAAARQRAIMASSDPVALSGAVSLFR